MSILKMLTVSFLCALAAPARAQTPAERAWGVLEQAIQDPKDERRASAAHALGLLVKNERALELAKRALADQSPEVRAAAATALGQIGLAAGIPSLKAALQDKETEVVFSTAAALYALKTRRRMPFTTLCSPVNGRRVSRSSSRSSTC